MLQKIYNFMVITILTSFFIYSILIFFVGVPLGLFFGIWISSDILDVITAIIWVGSVFLLGLGIYGVSSGRHQVMKDQINEWGKRKFGE